MSLKESIKIECLPEHIAIIMDGNGRWAQEKNKKRIFGHRAGVKSVREVTEAAAELGVKYVTLYAFSTENWNRPKLEISALMGLLLRTIRAETKELHKNNIRLRAIGNLNDLPDKTHKELLESIESTKDNDRMDLILALSYSGRNEITKAAQSISKAVAEGKLNVEDIDERTVNNYLFTHNIPDPELLIRTSGETRISNFLLWQLAYAELYFSPKYWPEFRKEDLYEAIIDFQKRERRFGKTSAQITDVEEKIKV